MAAASEVCHRKRGVSVVAARATTAAASRADCGSPKPSLTKRRNFWVSWPYCPSGSTEHEGELGVENAEVNEAGEHPEVPQGHLPALLDRCVRDPSHGEGLQRPGMDAEPACIGAAGLGALQDDSGHAGQPQFPREP